MKQLKRLNLKSGTTLNSAEMKQILGGMVTTPAKSCPVSTDNCKNQECTIALEGMKYQGICQVVPENPKLCACTQVTVTPPLIASF